MNIQKLLDRSEPWLQYAIHVNMPGTPKQDLLPLRDAALSDERIQNSLRDIAHFHNALVTYHKNPDLPLHKLLFLLSLGFDTDIPQIQSAIDQILEHHDEDGVYQSLTNVPKKFGGAGEDVFGWCLCDAPILLLCLIKAGVNYDRYVKAGVGYLVSLSRTNGFPCAV